jgi:hypothetical protein
MAFPDSYRFVPVRPSIVTLLSQIGGAEDFLFVFVLVWLACTYWILSNFIVGLPSLGSSVAFSARYVHRHHRALRSLRYAISRNVLPLCMHESSYHSQESQSPSVSSTRIDLYEDRSTSASSRTQSQIRNRRRALDRLYIDCLIPPRAQPGQLTNVQLCARRSRDRPYLRPGVLGFTVFFTQVGGEQIHYQKK